MDRYSAAALLNGCIWGLMGFFTRRMTALGLTPIGMLFIRFLVAGVLYAAVILCRDPSLFRIRWKDVPLFIAIGALGQFFLAYFYYSAIRVMSISTACALNYTSPLFVMILAWILFRERADGRGIAAVILCVLGSACASGFGGSVSAAGVLFGVLSAFCAALVNVLDRLLLKKGYQALTINFYLSVTAVGVSLLAHDAADSLRVATAGGGALAMCLAAGLATGFFPYLLFSYALRGCESRKVAVLGSCELVVAALTGTLVFREPLTGLGILGIGLILLGIVVQNTGRGQKKADASG